MFQTSDQYWSMRSPFLSCCSYLLLKCYFPSKICRFLAIGATLNRRQDIVSVCFRGANIIDTCMDSIVDCPIFKIVVVLNLCLYSKDSTRKQQKLHVASNPLTSCWAVIQHRLRPFYWDSWTISCAGKNLQQEMGTLQFQAQSRGLGSPLCFRRRSH